MTLVINPALGEYYSVQGTTWKHPPILSHAPVQIQVIAGKKLFEYYDGGKIALVAWHTPQASTGSPTRSTNTIPNAQMVAMAASLTPER